MQHVKEEYGEKVKIRFKSFMLRPEYEANRMPDPRKVGAWAMIEEQGKDVGMKFGRWDLNKPRPTHSLPALEAAKCAALQGSQAFERMHLGLMQAYFQETRDISDRAVLLDVAQQAGLDMGKFVAALDGGVTQVAVLAEDREARERYGINGIPVAIFNDSRAMIGAVPLEQYRMLIEKMLSGEIV